MRSEHGEPQVAMSPPLQYPYPAEILIIIRSIIILVVLSAIGGTGTHGLSTTVRHTSATIISIRSACTGFLLRHAPLVRFRIPRQLFLSGNQFITVEHHMTTRGMVPAFRWVLRPATSITTLVRTINPYTITVPFVIFPKHSESPSSIHPPIREYPACMEPSRSYSI